MHNIIFENERIHDLDWDFIGLLSSEIMHMTSLNLEMHQQIHDQSVHQNSKIIWLSTCESPKETNSFHVQVIEWTLYLFWELCNFYLSCCASYVIREFELFFN
jgi:hypothetical protein